MKQIEWNILEADIWFLELRRTKKVITAWQQGCCGFDVSVSSVGERKRLTSWNSMQTQSSPRLSPKKHHTWNSLRRLKIQLLLKWWYPSWWRCSLRERRSWIVQLHFGSTFSSSAEQPMNAVAPAPPASTATKFSWRNWPISSFEVCQKQPTF